MAQDDRRDVYVMNTDGTGLTRLTDGTGAFSVPVWSPDGSKLVFHAATTGKNEIYVMNADGTNLQRLTTGTEGLR